MLESIEMRVRLLCGIALLACALLAVPASAAQLPGLRSSDLGRLAIDRSDIRTLNAAVPLESAELQRAYEMMKVYEQRVQDGSRDAMAAMTSLEPPALGDAKELERAHEHMVDSVRDRIEERRRAGEFRDDPGGLREAWQDAMDEADRELKQIQRDNAQVEGWDAAFREQAVVLAIWYETRADMDAQLLAGFGTLVGPERHEQLSRWWLKTRLSSAITRSRLSGEAYDPFSHVLLKNDAVDFTRDAWEAAHITLLDTRDAAIRRVPLVAADAISRGNLRSLRRAFAEAMAGREDVREHALEGAKAVAVLLDDAAAIAYEQASSQKAFPAAWRRGRASRSLVAARSLSSLDEAQKALLAAMQLEHEQLVDDLRDEHIRAVRAEEGNLLAAQDLRRSVVLFSGAEVTPQSTPLLDASKHDRRGLSDDTMSRLQSILTESQWRTVPGTQTQPAHD